MKLSIKESIRLAFYNIICKMHIELCGRHDNRKMKYDFALCLIFKNEAAFLKEWIDYHRTIGVEHFYLYNNNSTDNYIDILEPYISEGIVTLIDFPYEKSQMKAYKDCYEKYKSETKWMAFIDADEFICPRYDHNIKSWLKKFDKYPAIVIYWLNFGTNGKIKHDYSQNVIEQYTLTSDKFWPEGKTIINTRYEIANYDTWYLHHQTHTYYTILGIRFSLPAINQYKKFNLIGKVGKKKSYSTNEATIQINHYFMKAWDIYCKKAHETDVYYGSDAPRKNLKYMFDKEESCIKSDYTIYRFLVRMKLTQGIIDF